LPGKHLLPLADRPLIDWTFQAALASRRLDRVILSTDAPDIAAAARAAGIDVPFVRPDGLARDETPMIDVLVHAVAQLEQAGDRADAVVLLQPTSPLRTAGHIDQAVAQFEASGADAVVSVVQVPHRYSPPSVLSLDGDRLTPFLPGPAATRRQDKPAVYARNGPAVLVVRRDVLMEQRSLYGVDTRAFLMSEADSVDVDTAWDLSVAALALAGRGAAGQ